MITLENLIIAQGAFNVLILLVVVFLLLRGRKQRRTVQLLTAEHPEVKTDAALVREWAYKYRKLPKGSPKRAEYRKRLIEAGVLQEADGN